MNYPIWEIPNIGSAFWVAFMTIPHVYIAHFAIGGGLFLVLTELKAYRENSEAILNYTRSHAKFFLLLTMVYGGVSGVGIWFTIALANPQVTSSLIHTFVFGWAIEWVFFLGEIVALLIYHYYFDRLQRKDRTIDQPFQNSLNGTSQQYWPSSPEDYTRTVTGSSVATGV